MNGRTIFRVAAATLVMAGTVAAVLVGVSESGQGAIGRHVLITTPSDGAEVAVGSRVQITAQGFDPRGVIRWTVTVAGDRLAAGELGEDGPTHVPIEAEWVPDETGTFDIEVRVVGVGERERPPDRRTVRVVAAADSTTTTASRSTSTTRRTATTDTTVAGETTTSSGGSTTTEAGTTVTTSRTSTTAATGSTGTTARTGTTRTTSPTSTSPRSTATTATTRPTTTAPPTTAPPTTAPDTTPPRVSAQHSPTTTIFSGDRITFTATATDDRALSVVEVWVQAPGANSPSIVASCPSSPCSHTTTARAGDYSYFGIARDAAGNQARSAPRTVFVNSPPF